MSWLRQDTSPAVSSGAHSRFVVLGVASTRWMTASPSVRANESVPPAPQPRGSFSVVITKPANSPGSTGSPASTATLRVRTGPGPGAGVEPGTTTRFPFPSVGTSRAVRPAWTSSVGRAGVVGAGLDVVGSGVLWAASVAEGACTGGGVGAEAGAEAVAETVAVRSAGSAASWFTPGWAQATTRQK